MPTRTHGEQAGVQEAGVESRGRENMQGLGMSKGAAKTREEHRGAASNVGPEAVRHERKQCLRA